MRAKTSNHPPKMRNVCFVYKRSNRISMIPKTDRPCACRFLQSCITIPFTLIVMFIHDTQALPTGLLLQIALAWFSAQITVLVGIAVEAWSASSMDRNADAESLTVRQSTGRRVLVRKVSHVSSAFALSIVVPFVSKSNITPKSWTRTMTRHPSLAI